MTRKLICFLICLTICVCFSGCFNKSESISTTYNEGEENISEKTTVTENYNDNETNVYEEYSEVTETPKESVTNAGFKIEGKWKNIGENGWGQAQPGSIVVFNGTNCNFFSPNDTYAFYMNNGSYTLDCTSYLFSQNLSFDVTIIDNDNIIITYGSNDVKLLRVG